MITVLVCGGRKYDGVFPFLNRLHADHGPIGLVIHGGAGQIVDDGRVIGADAQAGLWARRNQVNCLRVPAKWGKHGRAAGMIRNREMLELSFGAIIDLVVAFPGGVGTAGMVGEAEAAGLRVMKVPS